MWHSESYPINELGTYNNLFILFLTTSKIEIKVILKLYAPLCALHVSNISLDVCMSCVCVLLVFFYIDFAYF